MNCSPWVLLCTGLSGRLRWSHRQRTLPSERFRVYLGGVPTVSRLSAAIPHAASLHTTAPSPTTPVSGTAPVQSRVAKGLVNSCRWHGMQGVRGSNPLSSTNTTPQVTGLALLVQRRFLPLPDCSIRATRVPLGAGGGLSVRLNAALINSPKAAAMARPGQPSRADSAAPPPRTSAPSGPSAPACSPRPRWVAEVWRRSWKRSPSRPTARVPGRHTRRLKLLRRSSPPSEG
jgi:hypothetical protein